MESLPDARAVGTITGSGDSAYLYTGHAPEKCRELGLQSQEGGGFELSGNLETLLSLSLGGLAFGVGACVPPRW